ncbi:hypothetical protein WNB94_07745 [Aquabacterium sp. A3]
MRGEHQPTPRARPSFTMLALLTQDYPAVLIMGWGRGTRDAASATR